MTETMDSVDTLKQELERLNLELDQTSSEKNQAAQYGLVLLEEKESLQSRCEELEALYENTKHELEGTREVRWCRDLGREGHLLWLAVSWWRGRTPLLSSPLLANTILSMPLQLHIFLYNFRCLP